MGGVWHQAGCCCPPAIYELTPCVEKGGACTDCDNGTPKFWTLIVSGMDQILNVCCDYTTGHTTYKITGDFGINDTYLLEQEAGFGNECHWDSLPVKTVYDVGSWWENGSCSGEPDVSDIEIGHWAELRKLGTNLILEVNLQPGCRFPCLLSATRMAFYDIEVTDFCHLPVAMTNQNDQPVKCGQYEISPGFWATGWATGGSAILIPGDQVTPNARCPGGNPIYTDTDLSLYVGRTVLLNDGICYDVAVAGDTSDGPVTVSNDYDDCDACCA